LLRRFLRSVDYNGFRGAVAKSFSRFSHSLKSNGLGGTFDRGFAYAMPPTAAPVLVADQPHPFDKEYGTDTGGRISSGEMVAVSLSALHASGYAGVPPSTLRPALAALPIKHQEFTFIDIGCGKGRALLVAAEFPFRRIVGVELAVEMAQVARANVALNPAWNERISICNEDALSFELPDGPVVLFLYHPFTTMLLRRFLAKIERQIRRSPRPAFLIEADVYTAEIEAIYAETPRCRAAMESFPFLREVSDLIFPISADEAAVEVTGGERNRFTVFSVDATR
jgi:SAM-dependent methyltransferase